MKQYKWKKDQPNQVIFGDNLEVLNAIPDESINLIYIDPPFNTGRVQKRQQLKTVRSTEGNRVGFKGASYETVKGKVTSYDDSFADSWAFLEPRLEEEFLAPPKSVTCVTYY